MGDVLHALPAVAALRRLHPDWFLGWLIDHRWSPLLQAASAHAEPGCSPQRPIVDRIHIIPTQVWKHRPISPDTALGIARMRRDLCAEHYDLAIDMQGLIRSAVAGALSGSRRFVGRKQPRERIARWFYSEKILTPARHVVEQGCELVSGAIHQPLSPGLVDLPIDSAAEQWVDDLLDRTLPRPLWNRFAFFAPTAGWGAKQWPKERYGAVALALAEAGYATFVNAAPAKPSPNETQGDPSADAVAAASLGTAIAVPSTLPQMMALVRRACLVIAGDTGPLHLAAALRRPVVALFGPTDPARTGPYDTPSRVLRHASSVVDHSRRHAVETGLSLIPTAEVVAVALDLLRESEQRSESESRIAESEQRSKESR
jgi:heptosyltransferase-1